MQKAIFPLSILVVIAIVLIAMTQPKTSKQTTLEGPLLAELATSANSVDKIRIKSSEGEVLVAHLVDGRWLASNFHDYPVDQKKLSSLMQGLVKAKREQPKTSKPENYVRLGVEPIDAENANSVLVEVFSQNTPLASVVIGNEANSGGTYVRLFAEEQTWLVNERLTAPINRTDWLQQPILNIDASQVSAFARLGDKGWEMYKNENESDSGKWQLKGYEDAELAYATILENTVNNITNLRFDSVELLGEGQDKEQKQDLEQAQTVDAESVLSFRLTLTNSGQIMVEFVETDDGYQATFSSPENDYFTKYVYDVSAFSVKQFDKQLSHFLAEQEEPEQEE
ncbi:DUF4340 domain-containing protein [Alteromonas sp. a30]|uniref:DUF4340 domain-containing protein n=1 Tax=Alteromonas sp. a30 TaxID=2730917 RepID=UPI00227E1E58|nr:DUF4340 domain-containing protein [Alteromonas sp. a30]MCY7295985.1 DUF4340 domain-containing protein [Alteromonas sp. a30]